MHILEETLLLQNRISVLIFIQFAYFNLMTYSFGTFLLIVLRIESAFQRI